MDVEPEYTPFEGGIQRSGVEPVAPKQIFISAVS